MTNEGGKSSRTRSSRAKSSTARGRGAGRATPRKPASRSRKPTAAANETETADQLNDAVDGEPTTDEAVTRKTTKNVSKTDAETAETVDAVESAAPTPRPDEAEDATILEDSAVAAEAAASASGDSPEQATESLDVESIVEETTDRIEEALAEEATAISATFESKASDAAAGLADEKDALAAAFGATAGTATAAASGAVAGAAAAATGPVTRSGSGGGSGREPPEDDDGFIGGPERPRGGGSGSGWMMPFAAALLGAVIGGGGAYLALKDSQPDATVMAKRFVEKSALDARIVAVETAAAEQVTEVSKIYDGRASEIDANVRKVAKDLRTASAEAASALAATEKHTTLIAAQGEALAAQTAEIEALKQSLTGSIDGMTEKLGVLEAPRDAYAEDVAELRGLMANLATLVTANGVPGGGEASEGGAQVGASGDPLGAALATRMALLESKMKDLAEKFDAPSEAEAALGEHVDAVDTRVAELETLAEKLETAIADQKFNITGLTDGVAATGEETAKWRADIEQAIELTGSEILRHDEWIIQADEHLLQIDTRLENSLDRYGELNEKMGGVDESLGAQLAEALKAPAAQLQTLGAANEQQGATIASIAERVASLEQTSQAFVKGEAAVGVAFAALSQAVSGSEAYDAQIETLEKVAEISAPEALAAHAKTGLPSKISLATRFADASRKALAASHRAAAEAEDAGLVGSVLDRVSSIIVVRRIDETEGDAPWAVLSRAGARVDEGDLATALKEIEALPQAGREAISGWIGDAEARVGAEKALVELRAQLLGVTSAPEAEKSEPEKPEATDNEG